VVLWQLVTINSENFLLIIKLKEAIREQLGYIRSNLAYVDCFCKDLDRLSLLRSRQLNEIRTIEKPYAQQI